MGAQLVREVANKTSDQTGDGTTTATLLAQAIVREGMKRARRGRQPDAAQARHRGGRPRPLSAELQRVARTVEGAELVKVATIAAKEDEVVGGVVAEALDARRPRGRRHDRGVRRRRASRCDFVEGMVVENGWLSPYMVRDPHRMETVFENPLVFMTNKALSIRTTCCRSSTRSRADPRPLVILCENARGERARHARVQHAARDDRGRGGARARLRPPARPAPRRPRGVLRRHRDRRGGGADARPTSRPSTSAPRGA